MEVSCKIDLLRTTRTSYELRLQEVRLCPDVPTQLRREREEELEQAIRFCSLLVSRLRMTGELDEPRYHDMADFIGLPEVL